MEISFPPSGSILHPLNDLGKCLVDAEKCAECSRKENEKLIRWNVLLIKKKIRWNVSYFSSSLTFFPKSRKRKEIYYLFYHDSYFLSFKMKCKKGNFKGKAFLMMWNILFPHYQNKTSPIPCSIYIDL